MKRIVSYILLAALLTAVLPAITPPACAALADAPEIAIVKNRLLADGRLITDIEAMSQYEFVLVRAFEAASVTPRGFTDTIIAAHRIYADPQNMKTGCVRRTTLSEYVTLDVGDILYARQSAGGTALSEWQSLRLTAPMFGLASASRLNQLPDVVMMEDRAVITPKDLYTEYEYCIIDASSSEDSLQWTGTGALYGNPDGAFTVSLLPRSTAYKLRVRIAGDDMDGYLFVQADGIPVLTPKVFLSQEILGPFGGGENGKSWFITTNGGKKWQLITAAPGADRYVELSKVFGKKEVEIIVRDIDAAEVKPPVIPSDAPADYSPGGSPDPTPEDIKTNVYRQTFNPRPDFPKEIAIVPFASEAHPDNFSFTGYSRNHRYEYRIEGQASDFARIDFAVGLPLLLASEQAGGRKPAKVYLRVPPDDISCTPASQPKKFNQVKQVKAPASKVDYKKETLKTKNGQFYAVGPVGAQLETLSFKPTNGDLIDVAAQITERSAIYIYQGETDKKSRSAIQSFQLGERFIRPDSGEGLTLDAKGKLKLQKGYEVYGSAEKWGNLKKGETQVLLRKKTNAKFNAKAGTTAGNAASLVNKVSITYSPDGKTVTGFEMEQKSAVPLKELNLTIPSGGNGYIAYTPPASGTSNVLRDGRRNYSIAQTVMLDSRFNPLTTAFRLGYAEIMDDDGQSLIASAVLTRQDGQEISLNGKQYDISDAAFGDVYSLMLTPVDLNKYRTTEYTVTIIEPLSTAPYRVRFGPEQGSMGLVTVTMSKALTRDDELGLTVRLVKVEPSGEKEIAVKTERYEFNPDSPAENNDFFFNFHEEISVSGKGVYRAYAYVNGEDGISSDSLETPSIEDLVVNPGDLKLCVVKTQTVGDYAAGGMVRIRETLDMLGNDLMSGAAFQWLRSDQPVTEANPGTEIPGSSSGTYSIPPSDEGIYLGVKVTAHNASVFVSFGQVNRTVSMTTLTNSITIDNTPVVIDPEEPSPNAGLTPIEFSYSGLSPEHMLTLDAPADDNIALMITAEQDPDIKQPDPETGEILPGPAEDDLVAEVVRVEHDELAKVFTIWVRPLNDGRADFTVSIEIGAGLQGYLRTAVPKETITVTVVFTEYTLPSEE